MAKQCVEDCIQLAVSAFGRAALRNWHSWGELTWGRGGKGTATINYSVLPEGLHLSYSNSDRHGHTWYSNYTVPVTYSHAGPCGRGMRVWWRCPKCNRRCGILYMPPGSDTFACRICHDLVYQVQMDRWMRENYHLVRELRRLHEDF
jgi:hypothetical protein